jgi:tetratricopeptide (TPR) repeat protein
MRSLIVLAALIGLVGCGARPAPSLSEQRVVLEQAPRSVVSHARLGWWRYLAGDAAGAAQAWAAAEDAPLAALGRARLADDRLDHSAALRASIEAFGAESAAVALIARRWAALAAPHVVGGAATLKAAWGSARTKLQQAKSTLRISFLPYLDLARLAVKPPVLKTGQLHALGQVWALTPGRSKPDADGLVLTVWPLEPGPAHIELKVHGLAMAWRDGVQVHQPELARHGAGRVRFEAPGQGPLVVVWAARSKPSAWRVAWPAPQVSAALGPVVPDRAAAPDWVDRWLDAELAVLDHDGPKALELLADAPQSAAFALLRARLAPLEPGRPDHARRDAARAHWTAALPLAPARAGLALGGLASRAGDVEGALAHLDAARALSPGAMAVHRSRARVLMMLDRPEEARRALAQAEHSAPDACTLLNDRAALGASTDGRAPGALAQAYLDCGRTLDAAERLLELHRPKAALAALDGKPTLKSDRVRRLRARALVGLGQLMAARALLRKGPSTDDALAAVDLAMLAEPSELASLDGLVAKTPTASAALTLMAARPAQSPFAPLLIDTEAAIAAYEATVPQPGPAVRVLDHSALLFFADGHSLRWVHEVLAIRSREAAETYGEIGLPTDTRMVALYTRKADGRRLFGEDVPEKDSITLPELASGDYVVASYLEPGDNGYLYDRGYLSRRVFFKGVDLPIFHQRFEVFSPDATPPDVQRLAGAPKPTSVKLGARAGWRFEARSVPLISAEPDAPSAALWLPSVRTGHNVTLGDDLAYLRDRVLSRRRRTARFEAWARAAAGEGALVARVRRLSRAVRAGIDDTQGLIDEDAARAVETGQGNRALVLSAALETLGVAHRLVTVRPRVHVPAGPFLQAADFPYPLILWAGGVIDPGPHRAAPGFVPWTVLGGDGLQIWPPDGPSAPAQVVPMRTVTDRRRVRVRAQWGDDGTLKGTVVDRLEGQEAIVIGHALSRYEPKQQMALVERLLVSALGAAKVTQLAPLAEQDPDGPLVLRYSFEAKVGDVANLALFPVSPGRGHAALPERLLPLQIALPSDQEVVLELESDRDFTVTGEARAAALGAHRFSRRVEHDGDTLRVVSTVVVAGGLIAPADYEGFMRWARSVDDGERLRLAIVTE